jgi:hypothetical protein
MHEALRADRCQDTASEGAPSEALRPEPTGILSEARDHTVALYDEARFYTVLGPGRQPRHSAFFTGRIIARKALGGLVNTPKGGSPAG